MTTEKEKVYIEDRLQRFAHWLGQIFDGKYTEEDQEWDEFIDRLVAVREGKAPAYDGGWIPCSYQEPPKEGSYLTTTIAGAVRVNHYYGSGHLWGYGENAIAWRPLPEAYGGKR